jgi:transposase
METLLSRTTSNAKEARRFRAWELHQAGWKQTAIADALGVSQGAVSQWLKRAKTDGVEALRSQPIPGAPRRLSSEQLAQLPSRLNRGAEAYGFRGHVWTGGRVREVIRTEFGVLYSERQAERLLKQIGWSPQKPVRRARQRDEAKGASFKEDRWPTLKEMR